MKVLVVDDSAADRSILSLTLRQRGWDVAEAEGGEAGLAQADALRPDLIISDALMPGMDGFQFLRTLKQRDELRSVPFVFYSAVYTGRNERELALSLGASGFITKPLEPEVFLAELDAILGAAAGVGAPGRIIRDDEAYLQKYSSIVAAKLEEKVAELTAEVELRKKAEEELRIANERLTALSRNLLGRIEAEKRHVAHELHDEIGQALTLLKRSLKTALGRTHDWNAERLLGEAIETADRAIGQVRDVSLNLRPSLLDDLGLAAAVRWYADRTARLSGIPVSIDVRLPEIRPASEVEVACFRICQEALTNAVKHAAATRITVTLRLAGAAGILLQVQDDGRGFDAAAGPGSAARGFGLLGMTERAALAGGIVEIVSTPGEGTRIEAFFPAEEARA